MKRDALELAVDYYNLQLELKERLAIFEEIIEQFCMDAEAQLAPQQENIQALLKKAAYEEENLAARKTVMALGYTYHGGELWKPPLGPLPQQPNHTEHPLEMVRKPFGYVTPGGEFRKTPEAANAYEWGQKFIAVYTLPQRKPLTTEEILKWYASENGLEDMYMAKLSDFETMVRAVEKKHKIKDASVDHIPDAGKMVGHPAIKLKVPNSGIDWLDEMIVKSLRDDFAAKAMHQMLHGAVLPVGYDATGDLRLLVERAYQVADAMMGARK